MYTLYIYTHACIYGYHFGICLLPDRSHSRRRVPYRNISKFVSLKLCLSVWLLTHPLKKRWFSLRCSQHFSVVKNLTDQAMPPAAWATKLGVWSVGPRAATWCWRGTGGIRKNPMAHMVAIKFRPKIEGFNHSSHIQMWWSIARVQLFHVCIVYSWKLRRIDRGSQAS